MGIVIRRIQNGHQTWDNRQSYPCTEAESRPDVVFSQPRLSVPSSTSSGCKCCWRQLSASRDHQPPTHTLHSVSASPHNTTQQQRQKSFGKRRNHWRSLKTWSGN